MADIKCLSKGLNQVLSELAPKDEGLLKEVPECLDDKLISFGREEKIEVVKKSKKSLFEPIFEPVIETTGKMIKPMVKPTMELSKKVGIGVIVSLIVLTIVNYINKKK